MDKSRGKILIVDDNTQILKSLEILLKPEFEEIVLLKNPNQIPFSIQRNYFDLILLDMNFKSGDNSGNEGLFWLSEILKYDPMMVVIMITAYGDIDLAVKAIRNGATDFISKPWDAEKLIITLRNGIKLRSSGVEVKKLQTKQKQINDDIARQNDLFRGTSKKMEEIYRTIDKVAQTDANVLILGENGTGKEVIAREIHIKSRRASEIFLAVDMGSLSENLFESEMFGHVKGSFTDAREDRVGRFETASGGTLFMDEIANMSLASQSKLLGVLQNLQITRIGSNRPIAVDFRLISATNKNPQILLSQGIFREDLLFRINTIQIELPPLRDRREDIPGLSDFYLKHFSLKYEKTEMKFSESAYDSLINYHWSGNVRELKHTIEKTVILTENAIIKASDLDLRPRFSDRAAEYDERLSDIEKNAIVKVLEKCRGNITQAAKILDISRTTLYTKMKEYKI